jgi:ATP-dependent Lon protease
MPGKIIKAVTRSGVSNPVLLIDEIDKMSSDYKGDPTSAMLEVLDPEQNSVFQDHYLEFEYDLSKVIFVVTANYYQNIPEPLLDRMEVIELNSYTDLEKMNIAKKHLIKRTLKNNGLTAKQFQIGDTELKFIINRYTMESGVRNLIRALDKVARKLVVIKLKKKLGEENIVTIEQIKKLLGTPIFDPDKQDEKPQIGAVTAIAYTQYGGTTMSIEATQIPGKGNLKLTGRLADVMSESANIALTYVKSNAKKFGITTDFSKFDIHIHAAAGAISKDGPSAGVTFATTIISMLKKHPVSQTVAMTGELTLRGHVLPIGGLKEKSLAALRMGIKTIFIPQSNQKNLKDFKSEIKNKIKYYPVDDYMQIYNKLFK